MGNSHCVPQAPRRLRASFSRKPSLKGNREDGTRKLAGLFGTEASPDADAAAGKIFYYIPGTDLPGLESQRESLEQPFLSVFKRGRRRVPVRSLGKVVHYAKVQLRFQHSQDVSDCYLELFPSHLYFQAHGSEGLTFQGLLPLMELSIGPLEESTEPAFQITGPLPAPLLVLCPSPAERDRWLYYLEKQMALAGGLRRCNSAPPQGPPEDELPWTLQRRLTRVRTASGRQAVGSAICASRVKLQHLPSQEQWDRLLVLYPTSLAIFSEEADGLCFKGELPLASIQVNLEEKEKQIRSFLIEGSLINTIRVLCASYEDYSRWLLCLQTVSRRGGAPLLPNPETFPGLRMPHQALGSGRGSLSSDGRTSWDSGYPGPPSTCTSHSLPESSALPTAGHPAQPVPDQPSPGCTSIGGQKAELRRGGSGRSPRSKARGEGPGPSPPLHLDLTKLNLDCGPEGPGHAVETPHSPLYADPYTPPATSHHKITDVRGLDEFLSAVRSSLGPAPASPFPSVPVSVPVSDPSFGPCGSRLPSKKGALQPRASQRQRGSSKGRGPPDSPQLVSRLREGSPGPLLPPADGSTPRSYDNIWDKATSPPGQRRPRGATEAEGGFIQWI
ncbi:pleckstrin homology domain-containing family N member 1 isoform X1 [Rousettus aegyptiacus]|uniref:Pleckstrin homology domain containing N1 n=1 Tax=Rousettus aegyptiacus TaxID=9407 RepID=A0A7J8KEI8_ROUAE|nr:pleckstrin homology domain-containing family N member 1 isoform X1 [Rousettus aegyptiacus]KAF6507270.1 pleckstrin homology domain containing N1 [Rousettus aegyptiacus]